MIQTYLVILVAVAAGLYLARQAYRSWKGGCGSGCGAGGCSPSGEAKPSLIAAEDLLTRARRRRAGD